jgi:hypothetical protein
MFWKKKQIIEELEDAALRDRAWQIAKRCSAAGSSPMFDILSIWATVDSYPDKLKFMLDKVEEILV